MWNKRVPFENIMEWGRHNWIELGNYMWISNILDTIWVELGNHMWINNILAEIQNVSWWYRSEKSKEEDVSKREQCLGRPWSRKEFDVVKELIKRMNIHFKIVVASGEQGSRIEFNWGKNGTSRVTVMF